MEDPPRPSGIRRAGCLRTAEPGTLGPSARPGAGAGGAPGTLVRPGSSRPAVSSGPTTLHQKTPTAPGHAAWAWYVLPRSARPSPGPRRPRLRVKHTKPPQGNKGAGDSLRRSPGEQRGGERERRPGSRRPHSPTGPRLTRPPAPLSLCGRPGKALLRRRLRNSRQNRSANLSRLLSGGGSRSAFRSASGA